MSTAKFQYPVHVQITNTYYHPGAPVNVNAVSDAEIAALANQMRATAMIAEQQAQAESHEFLIQYQ